MIVDYEAVREAGHNVVQLEENIFVIENFISEKDADFLLSFAKSLNEDQWKCLNLKILKQNAMESFGTDDIEALEKSGTISINRYSIDKSVGLSNNPMRPDGVDDATLNTTEKICRKYTDKLNGFVNKNEYELSPFYSMRRHYLDDGMPFHSDQKNTPKQRQSVVMYLNDDYVGGELHFRDQPVSVKPKARSVLIFNNGADYMHGVKTVLDGPTRYTLATFISVK